MEIKIALIIHVALYMLCSVAFGNDNYGLVELEIVLRDGNGKRLMVDRESRINIEFYLVDKNNHNVYDGFDVIGGGFIEKGSREQNHKLVAKVKTGTWRFAVQADSRWLYQGITDELKIEKDQLVRAKLVLKEIQCQPLELQIIDTDTKQLAPSVILGYMPGTALGIKRTQAGMSVPVEIECQTTGNDGKVRCYISPGSQGTVVTVISEQARTRSRFCDYYSTYIPVDKMKECVVLPVKFRDSQLCIKLKFRRNGKIIKDRKELSQLLEKMIKPEIRTDRKKEWKKSDYFFTGIRFVEGDERKSLIADRDLAETAVYDTADMSLKARCQIRY